MCSNLFSLCNLDSKLTVFMDLLLVLSSQVLVGLIWDLVTPEHKLPDFILLKTDPDIPHLICTPEEPFITKLLQLFLAKLSQLLWVKLLSKLLPLALFHQIRWI